MLFHFQRLLKEQTEKLSQIKEVLTENHLSSKSLPQPEKYAIYSKTRRDIYPNIRESVYGNDFQKLSNDINELKAKVHNIRSTFLNNGFLESLVINGSLEVTGRTHVVNLNLGNINGQSYNGILEDCVRKDNRNRKIVGQKRFSNGVITNLNVSKLNNVDASKVAYKSGEPVIITGDIKFENPVKVLGNVTLKPKGTLNRILLEDEVIEMTSKKLYNDLFFEQVITENANIKFLNNHNMEKLISSKGSNYNPPKDILDRTLYMPHTSLKIKNLNGEPFTQFLKKLYLNHSNKTYFVPGPTTVLGVRILFIKYVRILVCQDR